MVPKDFVKSRLESPVFEKSGKDFKGSSLNQPLNGKIYITAHIDCHFKLVFFPVNKTWDNSLKDILDNISSLFT